MSRISPILSLAVLLLFAVSATAHDKVVVIPLSDCEEPSAPTVTSTTGQVWMDRNLGASRVAISLTDTAAYGDLYQWGRLEDGHESRTSQEITTWSTTDVPGHGSFITGMEDWRLPPNPNLWHGMAGINNPCPSGFRLPTIDEWEVERASWSSNNAAGAFASPLKLVPAGRRHYQGGNPSGMGSLGSYWSMTVGGYWSRFLEYHSDHATTVLSYERATGQSVRCILD